MTPTPVPTGIETMQFRFDAPSPGRVPAPFAPVLVGVVGSGNLEVLLEPAAPGACTVRVETSARGFRPIWEAVLNDFQARHGLSGVSVAINDMGATPAVVSLRLDQAVAQMSAGAPAP